LFDSAECSQQIGDICDLSVAVVYEMTIAGLRCGILVNT